MLSCIITLRFRTVVTNRKERDRRNTIAASNKKLNENGSECFCFVWCFFCHSTIHFKANENENITPNNNIIYVNLLCWTTHKCSSSNQRIEMTNAYKYVQTWAEREQITQYEHKKYIYLYIIRARISFCLFCGGWFQFEKLQRSNYFNWHN